MLLFFCVRETSVSESSNQCLSLQQFLKSLGKIRSQKNSNLDRYQFCLKTDEDGNGQWLLFGTSGLACGYSSKDIIQNLSQVTRAGADRRSGSTAVGGYLLAAAIIPPVHFEKNGFTIHISSIHSDCTGKFRITESNEQRLILSSVYCIIVNKGYERWLAINQQKTYYIEKKKIR